ncbi:MAG: VIT1/CCC1 family protein, partial [Bullifex sp.]
MEKQISEKTRKIIIGFQENELTEALVYEKIASFIKNDKDKQTLLAIAADERRHAAVWKGYSGVDAKPRMGQVRKWTFLARVLGYTFALKKMENGEKGATKVYDEISKEIPEAKKISEDEDRHEHELLAILDEERLRYVGSMVLGLSDALVELSGTLAGLTFALQDNKLIALSGLITGISATLSMGSSEYLSAKSDGDEKPFKSALYTGIAYVITVTVMILPYLLLPSSMFMVSLGIMLASVVLIIAAFSYYVSVAQELAFKRG